MKKCIDEQVAFTFDESEAMGMCLFSYSETVKRAMECRVASGDVVSPMPRLYARAEHWDQLNPFEREIEKMRALAQIHPDWWFTGTSAAVAYGLSVSYSALRQLHVAGPRGAKSYHDGAVVSRHINIDDAEGTFVNGVPVLGIKRVLLDCAYELGFRDAVAVFDSALRLGLVEKDELVCWMQAKKKCPGIRRARELAAFADGRAQSGGESIARAAMWELGFCAPDLQVEFRDPIDDKPYFADFCWRLDDGRVIVGELDGAEKYYNPAMAAQGPEAARRAERLRESRLTGQVTAVVRFSPQMVADNRLFTRLLTCFGVPRGR